MANDENLQKGIATRFCKGAAASEAGRKGGLASGETRRKKRAMKEALQELLAMPIGEGDLADITAAGSLKALEGANITVQDKILLEVILKAAAGDVRAAEFIRDTTEGKPAGGQDLNELLPVFII